MECFKNTSLTQLNKNFGAYIKYKDITIPEQTIASKGKILVDISPQIPAGYSVISSQVIGGSYAPSIIHYHSFVSYSYLNIINNDAVALTTSVIVRVFFVNDNAISMS